MKTALLVLDDEPQRAEELCFLLRFLEETHVVRAESSNWQLHVEHNADLRCVFLGRYGSAGQIPSDAIHAIRTLAPRAALILIEEADHPVRWIACVKTMQAFGADTFVEAGPGKTLCGFNRRIDRSLKSLNVENLESLQKTLDYLKEVR